ncbi:MAG: ribosome maturation factor RimP [Alphaproteobacteria bacterium]|nr:ribosome maturation factor RimP [Alphaproteobacteria bacterium]
MAAVEQQIRTLIEPAVEDMGYDIVRVRYSGAKRPTLQIMADRKDEAPITVEDCADISRAVSAILDVEDPIAGAYALEVSSPGIDRPLVRPRDFERFAGFEAKLETARPIDGRKRYRGVLVGLEGGDVTVDLETGERAAIPFAEIATAKLVMTDALLDWAAAQQEAHALYDAEDVELEAEEDGADESEMWDDAPETAGRA